MKLRSEPLRGESALNMRVLVGRSFGDPTCPNILAVTVTSSFNATALGPSPHTPFARVGWDGRKGGKAWMLRQVVA